MTRAAEFCYIAEQRDGQLIMAMRPLDSGAPVLLTKDPEQAVRFTRDGIHVLQRQIGGSIGARKILAG